MFDSRKKIKAMTAAGIESKLVPSQLEKISYNRALVLMYGNQVFLQYSVGRRNLVKLDILQINRCSNLRKSFKVKLATEFFILCYINGANDKFLKIGSKI